MRHVDKDSSVLLWGPIHEWIRFDCRRKERKGKAKMDSLVEQQVKSTIKPLKSLAKNSRRFLNKAEKPDYKGECVHVSGVHTSLTNAVRIHKDCRGNRCWYSRHGFYRILRKAYSHSHQFYHRWRLNVEENGNMFVFIEDGWALYYKGLTAFFILRRFFLCACPNKFLASWLSLLFIFFN